jgi:hypothetical protein
MLAFFLAGTLVFMFWLARQGVSLTNTTAPEGVVSFEFAGTAERAEEIIGSWAGQMPTAKAQIWIDFGFLIFYPLWFSLACAMLSKATGNPMPTVGAFISWAVLLALPLDLTEDVGLLWMLYVRPGTIPAQVSFWCAGVKFVLVFAAMGYLVLVGSTTLLRQLLAS